MIETLLVGFGRFGKEHLLAWEATGRAQISAIVDPTLTIAVLSPDCQRSIPVFASIAEIPANVHFDAAAIVTPFSFLVRLSGSKYFVCQVTSCDLVRRTMESEHEWKNQVFLDLV